MNIYIWVDYNFREKKPILKPISINDLWAIYYRLRAREYAEKGLCEWVKCA